MVAERTEDLALLGVLPITFGSQAFELPTLVASKSDAWLETLAAAIAGVSSIPEPEADQDGAELMAALLTSSTAAAIEVIRAYDLTGMLADVDIYEVASKAQIKTALMSMVTVEDPFGEAAGRSAAAALGERSRLLGQFLGSLADDDLSRLLATSTNGHSEPTDSTTAPSKTTGARSRSSSVGPTRKPRKRGA